MKPQLISFDAAGTLIDVNWQPGHFAVCCALDAGAQIDPQIGEESYSRLLASRWKTYCAVNLTKDDAACDRFWRDLASDWLNQIGAPAQLLTPMLEVADSRLYGMDETFKLYPDVLPNLRTLKAAGWRMVLLSNWDYSLHRVVVNLGLQDFFEFVFASLQIGPEKPDVRLFRYVEERVGLRGDEIVHVGDHVVDDVEGARNAGWKSLFLERNELGCKPPRISSLSQLLEALDWID